MARIRTVTDRVAIILLSGGSSLRMGTPKALLNFAGKTFIEKIVADYREIGCDPIIVVTGEHTDVIRKVVDSYNILCVVNDHPESGPFSSLKIGVNVLSRDCAGFFVAPVDHPAVAVQTLRRMLQRWQSNSQQAIKPTYRGSGGHPVLMGRKWIKYIQEWPISSNLRRLMREKSDNVINLPISDPGILINVDSKDDYHKLLKYQQ